MNSNLAPKLRFPEFRDAGEWKQQPIGTKANLLTGYPFKSSEISEDLSGMMMKMVCPLYKYMMFQIICN